MRNINVNTISNICLSEIAEKETVVGVEMMMMTEGDNEEPEFVCPSIGPLVFLFFCGNTADI